VTARRLILSPRAAADLEELAEYIARDGPVRAAVLVAELEAKCQAAARAPEQFSLREDLGSGVRMAVHGRYLVLFRDLPEESAVRIERVVHGGRLLSRLLQ
jgi:toxin ParE1/3/4